MLPVTALECEPLAAVLTLEGLGATVCHLVLGQPSGSVKRHGASRTPEPFQRVIRFDVIVKCLL